MYVSFRFQSKRNLKIKNISAGAIFVSVGHQFDHPTDYMQIIGPGETIVHDVDSDTSIFVCASHCKKHNHAQHSLDFTGYMYFMAYGKTIDVKFTDQIHIL
jgi:hypothetical protein